MATGDFTSFSVCSYEAYEMRHWSLTFTHAFINVEEDKIPIMCLQTALSLQPAMWIFFSIASVYTMSISH